LGDLSTPESVQRLWTAFHAKAKDEPDFRFYALYDKIYRQDVLEHAYACCRANKGAAGVDVITFETVEAYGRERWIGELAQQLREENYRPGMDQLLQAWSCHESLSIPRQIHHDPAAPVARQEA
jgi:RNA-directed DNA polymerase